jgi:hypothetical protein
VPPGGGGILTKKSFLNRMRMRFKKTTKNNLVFLVVSNCLQILLAIYLKIKKLVVTVSVKRLYLKIIQLYNQNIVKLFD